MLLLQAAAYVVCFLCTIAVSAQIAPPGSEVSAGSLQPYNLAPSQSSSTEPSSSSLGRRYEYSKDKAKEDLKHLCEEQPYLSGCSLHKLCSQGLDPVSIGKVPQTCDKFKLLATMCQFDKLAVNAKVS